MNALRGKLRAIARGVLVLLAAALVGLGFGSPAAQASAGITIDEPFDSTSWGRFTPGGSAALTAATGVDLPGTGWLRLNEAYGTVGWAYADDVEFPSNQAWTAEFDYAEWGGEARWPGDGITFYMWDAAREFQIGAGGGCMGYCGLATAGMAGGYFAVGLDEFGNFSVGPNHDYPSRGSIVLRGSEAQEFPVLASRPVDGMLQTWDGTGPWQDPIAGRGKSARIRVSSTDGRHVSVEMRRPQESWTPIFTNVELPGPAPARLKLGFASASGATDQKNEIRRFTFSTAAQLDYAVSLDDGQETAPRSQPTTWQVQVKNQGTGTPSSPVELQLSSSEGLDGITWSCKTDTGAACGSGTGSTATASSAVPAGKTYTFTVRGTPSATAQAVELTATARNTDASVVDIDASNDSATDRTPLRAPSPIASAGADQSVSEGALVTLDASASRDPDGNPISYSWKLVSGSGPTPVLTTTTGTKPQFQALDDGRWTFRVTVDNGLGDPSTDEVTVTAVNKAPALASSNLAGRQGGASLLTATVSDEGIQDRHTARVDWGDGTATQDLAITSGSGWASTIGVHRYASAGTYTAQLTITDDDGGQTTKQLTLTAARPGSIWANSTTDPFLGFAFNWLGLGGKLTGTLHSNASINIGGLGNTIEGSTEYVKNYLRLGLGISVPTPTKVAASSPPAGLSVNDFKPGGPVATELGSAYHDMTSSCRFGVWGVLTPSSLTDGVYYAPCDVNITALHARGRVTLVSTGTIHFTGDDSEFSPYYKGVLALSSKTSGDAIEVVGEGDRLTGILDGRGADIELTGAGLRLSCGIIGNRVSITGADVRVEGGDCSPPAGTVADARVIPEVQTRLEANRSEATPGDVVRYTATLTNAQGGLFINGLVGVQNTGTTNAQVTSSTYELQYQGTDKQWRTIASSADATNAVPVSTYPMASPGVSYGASTPAGTTVGGGALAAWGYQARVRLSAADAKLLWDPAKALAVRSVLRLGLTGDARARELSPLGEDITTVLRAASPDVTDARAYLAPPTGDVRVFSAATTPALARIAPGESRTVSLDHTLAKVDPRAPGEPVSAYLKRLRAADGAQVRGTLYARATGAGVPLFGAQQRAATTRQVPIVDLDLTGPASLLTGAQAPYKLALENSGSAAASALAVAVEPTAGTMTVSGVPGSLAPGQSATATATLTAPGAAASVRQTATASWQDANGNAYGTVQRAATTEVRTPATLRFTKTATLAVDADDNSRISVGDTVEYAIVAENTGGSPLTGVTITDPVPAKLRTVDGSLSATQGTATLDIDGAGNEVVGAPIGMIAGGAQVTVKFRATVRALPAGSTKPVPVNNQAVITSDQLAPERSDDPDTIAAPDPTTIQVVPSAPKLEYSFEVTLAADADGDGNASPGDTLRVQFVAKNTGNQSATGLVLRAPVPQFESLVPGTLESTGGPVAVENGVPTGRLDRLFGNDRFGIRYDVRIDATLPDGIDRVINAASAASNELPTSGPAPIATLVSVPAHLSVTKTGQLTEDRDGNGAVSRGDVLTYRVVVNNPTTTTAMGVTLTDSLDASTSLVAGSIALTQGTSSVSGLAITANIGPIAGGGTVTLSYRVLVGTLAAGDYDLTSQASASSSNLGTTKSDDPSGAGGQDATSIPVVATPAAPPSLSASKRSWVSVDADSDGKASAGDTLAYEVTITNSGAGGATGVVATDKIDAAAKLLIGSVQAPSSATVLEGNTAGDSQVKVNLGAIAAGASAAFTYQVQLDPLPAGSEAVTSTGTVASNEVAPVPSGGTQGTVTPVEVPELVPPTIRILDPADGATITQRSVVRATLTPPAGQAIAEWCVYAQRVGEADASRKTVGCGTGAPASAELATFDPTTLPNGTYVLTVDATADGGGAGYASVTVVVSGALKPGRYAVSYTDMDLPIGTLPIRVTRSYDSFDKSTGDFGVGWRVGLDGFRVSVNRPLGQGGWTSEESDCMVLLGQRLCTSTDFADLRSHSVTVTWPDGRAETFDFTPSAQTGGVVLGGTAGFTPRKGATSKLRVAGDPALTYLADGNLYATDQESVYNPTQFELTSTDGTRFLLDVSTGLVSSTDPWGNTLTVDESGVHSSLGTEVLFTRDGQGRITRIDGPSGERRTYGYSAGGDLASVTDALGNTARYEYDAEHNLTRTIDPSGRPTRIVEYDAAGRISRITDAGGNRVDLDISADARTQTVTSPDGRLTTVTSSDERGNPTRVDKIADGQTRTTRFEYDEDDNQTKVTDPLGHSTVTTFDDAGNRLSVTDPLGNTTRYEYDASNRLLKTTAADGKATTLTRDQFGAVTKVTDPLGHEQSFAYDARGNQIAQTDALGRTVQTAYDAAGNATSVTDPSGATATSTFDPSGNVTSLAAPGLGTTQLQYDDEGQLTAMIDAAGNATRYSYDALGRRTGVTDQLGRSTVTSYDALGRKTQVTDREGVVSTFEYDEQSRLTAKQVGSERTTYAYDGAGRVRTAVNGDATVETAYDAADRPVSFSTTLAGSSTPDTVSYAYDAAGRRSSMSYGGVTDSYGYDSVGRLVQLASSQAGTFSYSYDAAGRRTELRRPNGVVTSYAYDSADAVTAIVHAKAGVTIDESRYGYDAAGRRTLVRQFDGPRSYSYDAAGRVTAADNPSPRADEAFAYDELGNRTGGGEVVDGANRLQSRTGFSYTWDREGRQRSRTNTATGEVTRFGWSDDGRLRSVTLPSGGVVRYAYDPLGRRITTTSTNGVRRVQTYGLDPNAVAEQSGSDPRTRYTFGLGYDTPLAMSTASATAYFQQDALSSVTSLTNTAGAVTGRTSYDTYGQITSQTGQVSPYTYTGREWEPQTGLYQYRARWYDPATGTFTSEDPVPAANLYGYVGGQPTTLIDPTGMVETTLEGQEATQSILSQIGQSALRGGGLGGLVSGAKAALCGASFVEVVTRAGQGFGVGLLTGAVGGGIAGGVGRAASGAVGKQQIKLPFERVLTEKGIGRVAGSIGQFLPAALMNIVAEAALGDIADEIRVGPYAEAAGGFADIADSRKVSWLADLIVKSGAAAEAGCAD